MMNRNRILLILLLLCGVVGMVSAATTEHVTASGGVMTKGLTGILIPLGIELFVSAKDAVFLYNMLSISVLLFIAAMAGARSEAAFCIIIPIFALIFEGVGWMRMTDPVTKLVSVSATTNLFILTVIMALFGVMIYMNDQNRQNYGTSGPGAKMFNIAVYLALFNASLTLISGFSIIPMGPTQPIPGGCAVGLQCDSFGNVDFTSSAATISSASGAGSSILSLVTALPGLTIGAMLMAVNIVVGILFMPATLNNIMSGLVPGITSNAMYLAFLGIIELVVLIIYALGVQEYFWKPMPGTGSV